MKRILLSLTACLALCTLATPAAARAQHPHLPFTAGSYSANPPGAPIDDRTPNPPSTQAKMRAARKGRHERKKPEARIARVVATKVSTRGLAEARKAAALEQAQVRERAGRIYAVSQANAPILADTSACKRIGAHGESVYENCALLAASGASR